MGGKKKADGGPVIFAAIDRGDESEVVQLLKEDAAGTIALRNKDGWTPLIQSAYCGEAEILELLIKAGADVRAACKDGDTALHYAAAQGHADIIQMLAKAGAKLEVKDKDGETPYNVAGKNLKIRKLIQQLIDSSINDDEEEGGGEDADGEEWIEADEEEASADK